MRTGTNFFNLNGISDLAHNVVETTRDKVSSLVYQLIKLAMQLRVVTATVKRTLSAMNIVKHLYFSWWSPSCKFLAPPLGLYALVLGYIFKMGQQ